MGLRIFWAILSLILILEQNEAQSLLNSQYPYQLLPSGKKYGAVVIGETTWEGAMAACEDDLPGATLFSVDNNIDSAWLGERINIEKDRFSGSSKFWVGLVSKLGSKQWISGSYYVHHREVVQADGDDDPHKIYAWAVPDFFTRLKYEFLTPSDLGDSFICEYKA